MPDRPVAANHAELRLLVVMILCNALSLSGEAELRSVPVRRRLRLDLGCWLFEG
jgi:hypothetical protein